MAVLFWVLLFLAIPNHSSALFCECKSNLSDDVLQHVLDYACGNGGNCQPLNQSSCSNPISKQYRCSYAVASYYENSDKSSLRCYFNGAAGFVQKPPSDNSATCVFPGSSTSSPGAATNSPPSNSPVTYATPFGNSYSPPPPSLSGYGTVPPGTSTPAVSTTPPSTMSSSGTPTPPAITPVFNNGGAASPSTNSFGPDTSGADELAKGFCNFDTAALLFCSVTLLLWR